MSDDRSTSQFRMLVQRLATAQSTSDCEPLREAILSFPDFEVRLLEAICDSSAEVKIQAVLAIGALGISARATFQGVVALLAEDNEAVTDAAALVVEQLG